MNGEPQIGFRFRLLHPDGRQEAMIVDAERALIGSAAHCEVRLPPEISAHEHVEVVINEGAIYFGTRPLGRAQLPIYGGMATAEGRWDPGAPLVVGNVQMFVEVISLGMVKAKTPLFPIIAGFSTLIICAAAFAFAQTPSKAPIVVPEAPALIPPKEQSVCPNVAPEQRQILAAERLRVAIAKRERSPFAPQDGVDAVGLFEVAAACFRGAAQGASAAEAEAAATALRAKIEEDYRLRRIRLEHAYRVGDVPAAKREVIVLIPLLSQRRGPYFDWLLAVNRIADMQAAEKGSLKP